MARRTKRRMEWSKVIFLLTILGGFAISQEALALMYICITRNYTSTAAWLTAAVGLAEAVMGVGLSGYLGLAKSDHRRGGITYETARASGFAEEPTGNSPPI